MGHTTRHQRQIEALDRNVRAWLRSNIPRYYSARKGLLNRKGLVLNGAWHFNLNTSAGAEYVSEMLDEVLAEERYRHYGTG